MKRVAVAVLAMVAIGRGLAQSSYPLTRVQMFVSTDGTSNPSSLVPLTSSMLSGGGGGSGSVTSFTATNLPSLFTTTVTNGTTAPALAFTPATVGQNYVLAGPATGGTGAYGFRALLAADIPSLLTLYDATGAAASAQTAAQSFAANASNLSSGTVNAARLPASGATAGTYGSASAVPVITVDATGRVTSTTTAAISGGGATIPAAPTSGDTTPPLCNVAGALQNCTPDQMAAALASPKTFVMTGGVGTGAYANQCPAIPGAGLVSLVVNFDPTNYAAGALTCPAILDTSGNAHYAQLFSDGTQSVLGGPPPALTYPIFYAMALQQDPNVGVNGADCSQFVGTGHCTLPPGITPSFVGSSGNSFSGTSTTATNTYTVARAGDALIVTLVTNNATPAPTSAVSSNGITGTILNTAYDTNSTWRITVAAFQNMPAGAQTVTMTFASNPFIAAMEADEFQSVPTTGTYYEGVSTSFSVASTNTCATVTTTGTNELAFMAWTDTFPNHYGGHPRPGNGGVILPSPSGYQVATLATATTYTPTSIDPIHACVAFALLHK